MDRTVEDLDRYELGRLLTPGQQAMFFQLGNEIDSGRRSAKTFPQGEPCFHLAYVVGQQIGWTSVKACRAILTAAQAW